MKTALSIAYLLLVIPNAHAHGDHPWGPAPLRWSTDQIEEVLAFSARKISMGGRACLTGNRFYFKVRDKYAFDVDETVWLEVELHGVSANSKLNVSYDGPNGMEWDAGMPIQLPKDLRDGRHRLSIVLPHARFANLGFMGEDFAIYDSGDEGEKRSEFTICNVSLRRTATTPARKDFGWAEIEILDENGQQAPARLGLYDSSGRLPLPNEEAVAIWRQSGLTRVVPLGRGPTWPVKNRSVFYANGRYRAQLPVGEYELIAARGMEYRLERQRFMVRADKTQPIKIKLQRWADMAVKGWYSGDDHIHHQRADGPDDRALGLFTQAEDLRVSNILQMGNVATTYFNQRNWKPLTTDDRVAYALVPGQEDPRTTHRGHTIQLNIRKPVRDPMRYLLYHEVFEQVRAQGGLAGYAHVVDPTNGEAAMKGMAIDVPFALVDFAEIMTGTYAGDEIWFDFLNLGYKLTPSAGTDYPYIDIPGAARSYVKVEGPFTPQAWFNALKQGQVFVTSGPMLELSVNGQGMGSEIHVKRGEPLAIKAKAAINPDIDVLSSLELIEQGEPIKSVSAQSGTAELKLGQDLVARHGTWFVARASGKNAYVIAHSAPIYIVVDGQSFWKPVAVPAIVGKLKLAMQRVLDPVQSDSTERWETQELVQQHWHTQQELLKERIDQANAIYDDLISRAAAEIARP